MIGTCIEEFLFISSELSISYDKGLETNEILEEGVVVGCGDLGWSGMRSCGEGLR